MKSKFSDQDILQLLTGLKNAENKYPSDMISSRRDIYVKQAAAMAGLAKAGKNGVNSTGEGPSAPSSSAGFTPSIGKLLEIALITALMVEAVVVAYFYRDRIRDLINNVMPPRVEHITNPSDDPVLIQETPTAGTEIITETLAPTVTVTVTDETPVPLIAPDSYNPDSNNNESNEGGQVNATPVPKDNPGNHYGNTPKPERNKDSEDASPNKDKSNKK
jgi:hypothetical protein